MTESRSNDPLVALWKAAAQPDTRGILEDLQRFKRLRRRLRRTVTAILGAITVLLIVSEASGHIGTRGILSVIWIIALAIGGRWEWRARCDHIDALTSDPVSLLRRMLARAKRDLSIARWLYAGVPLGALVGGMLVRIPGKGRSQSAVVVHPQLDLFLTIAGAAVLVLMVAAGIILSRSRSLQVKALSEKLRSMETGL